MGDLVEWGSGVVTIVFPSYLFYLIHNLPKERE
jgi:hypothetical protein